MPIKRHPLLVAYSKDHHFGLLLGWKIKQGVDRGILFERISSYLKAFAEAELWPHFEKEEKYLFPVLPENDGLRLQAMNEHETLRTRMQHIVGGKAGQEDLLDFAKLLESHIRFEERQLFDHIQQQQGFEQKLKPVPEEESFDFDNRWPDHFWK